MSEVTDQPLSDSTDTTLNENVSNSTPTNTSPQIRDSLVEQAVSFLTDARIVSQDDNKKRRYLKTKGLTDEEIIRAFDKAKETIPQIKDTHRAHLPNSSSLGVPQQQVLLSSREDVNNIVSQIPSYGSLALIFFAVYGIGSALKYLVKYSLKFWFPKRSSLEERVIESEKKIENMTSYIDEQYEEIKDAVGVIKTFVENDIQEVSEKSKYDSYRRRNESSKLNELKKDVASIKFLLPTSGSIGRKTE